MRYTFLLILCFWAHPLLAQNSVLVPGFEDCLKENASISGQSMACILSAQSRCDALRDEPERALACYGDAKDEWGAKLQDLLASFSDQSEDLQKVVRIEAKYSVIFNLMNCDLRMELSQVGRSPEEADALTRAQCEAVATAASLTEVLLKSGTITR